MRERTLSAGRGESILLIHVQSDNAAMSFWLRLLKSSWGSLL